MATNNHIGSVASLWRYPVKSMMGEEIRFTEIADRGILGDRAYALVDIETGKIVSAKNPRKWPNLFSYYSSYLETPQGSNNIPPVRMTLPSGAMVDSTQLDINTVLSASLGRAVRLESQVPQTPKLEEYWPDMVELDNRDIVTDEAMPAGTFFDLAILHILTTSTIEKLSRLYPEGRFEVRRFRPNIVVQANTDQPDFVENSWIGKTLFIGDEVQLKITEPCPRCVMTILAQGDLPKDPGILRAAAQNNNAQVGVYASVVQAGTIRSDDEIRMVAD